MKCKFVIQNQKEQKCSDYYFSHKARGEGVYCRLMEWKQKKGVCPYDKKICSKSHKTIKAIKDKKQKTL
jgi:hypothetical protein